MNIESVNVGLPREIEWQGKKIRTAFHKQPALLPLTLAPHQLEGDAQADLRIHGGPDKAAYAYPVEHRAFWCQKLERDSLAPGAFGENFSVRGLLETEVCLGDRYRFGAALVEVSQPRLPCIKMAASFRREDLPHIFRRSGRSGFYLRVLEAGPVAAGDPIERTHRPDHGFTIHRLVRAFFTRDPDWDEVEQALQLPDLPDEWGNPLRRRAEKRR